ncbi:MAG: aldehyde dehydrogenase family protein, partial [Rhodomicrobium sp.]
MSVIEALDIEAGPRPADILARQREAYLRAGPPSLAERKDDIGRLRAAVKQEAERIASVISEDFGNRSRYETSLADIWPVVTSARETLKHLARWMTPKSVGVGLELLPGRARILYQPVGVVGIISPWNYPIQLAVTPLIAALAAGNRVMLKPSELTPRTSVFLANFLGRLFPEEKVATILGGPEVGAAFSALPFD